jgi:phosphatidylinositol alpha-1,6-mannosyltransferase
MKASGAIVLVDANLVRYLPMRMLLVTNDFPPKAGGIQQYLGKFVGHLDATVRVLAPREPGAVAEPDVFRNEKAFMWPTRSVRDWIEEHIASFVPDLVLYGAPYPLAQLGPRLRASSGVPFAVMTYGAEAIIPMVIPIARQLVVRSIRRADHVFSLSCYTGAKVERVTGVSPVVLGAGIDTSIFAPAERPGDDLVVGCVSRFIPRKGHARVLRSVAELRQRGHDVSALMVGTGRLEARLRRLSSTLEVPVTFATEVASDELPELYRRMSVFVMPSVSRWWGLEAEGLGLVYLEASASGLPVVAGSSGGAPETITPETGFVAGSVQEIVACVEPLLADAARRREMGSNGRAFVASTYSWNEVVRRFLERIDI